MEHRVKKIFQEYRENLAMKSAEFITANVLIAVSVIWCICDLTFYVFGNSTPKGGYIPFVFAALPAGFAILLFVSFNHQKQQDLAPTPRRNMSPPNDID